MTTLNMNYLFHKSQWMMWLQFCNVNSYKDSYNQKKKKKGNLEEEKNPMKIFLTVEYQIKFCWI